MHPTRKPLRKRDIVIGFVRVFLNHSIDPS